MNRKASERMNERTDKRVNQRMNEQTSERTNEWTNRQTSEPTNERTEKRVKQRINEQTSEWSNESTNLWTRDQSLQMTNFRAGDIWKPRSYRVVVTEICGPYNQSGYETRVGVLRGQRHIRCKTNTSTLPGDSSQLHPTYLRFRDVNWSVCLVSIRTFMPQQINEAKPMMRLHDSYLSQEEHNVLVS